MSVVVKKKDVVSHPAVRAALKELRVSQKRIRICNAPRSKRAKYSGLATFDTGVIVVWSQSCGSFLEIVYTVIHEIRHLWQSRRKKIFVDLANYEKEVMRAYRRAYKISYNKAYYEFHETLPTEVDADVYAATKLGTEFK